jgi:hypothetical protein
VLCCVVLCCVGFIETLKLRQKTRWAKLPVQRLDKGERAHNNYHYNTS